MNLKTFVVTYQNEIRKLIKVIYFIAFGLFFLALLPDNKRLANELGHNYGSMALIVYLMTITPGIIKRLKIKGVFADLQVILMLFRRELGILSFFLVFFHYMLLRGILFIRAGMFFVPSELYEVLGFIAFDIMFLLFITSNNYSVQKLGKWWGRLHSLTYLVIWLAFFHVVLASGELVLLVVTGIYIFAEVASLIYSKFITPKVIGK